MCNLFLLINTSEKQLMHGKFPDLGDIDEVFCFIEIICGDKTKKNEDPIPLRYFVATKHLTAHISCGGWIFVCASIHAEVSRFTCAHARSVRSLFHLRVFRYEHGLASIRVLTLIAGRQEHGLSSGLSDRTYPASTSENSCAFK